MSTHNIGFYEEISKIIPELLSNKHFISSSAIARSLRLNDVYLLLEIVYYAPSSCLLISTALKKLNFLFIYIHAFMI